MKRPTISLLHLVVMSIAITALALALVALFRQAPQPTPVKTLTENDVQRLITAALINRERRNDPDDAEFFDAQAAIKAMDVAAAERQRAWDSLLPDERVTVERLRRELPDIGFKAFTNHAEFLFAYTGPGASLLRKELIAGSMVWTRVDEFAALIDAGDEEKLSLCLVGAKEIHSSTRIARALKSDDPRFTDGRLKQIRELPYLRRLVDEYIQRRSSSQLPKP